MKLSQIIADTAARMRDTSVAVDTSLGTVCISDNAGEFEDIFMQGDDADRFIAECERAWNATGDTTIEQCWLWMASQFTDCIWG